MSWFELWLGLCVSFRRCHFAALPVLLTVLAVSSSLVGCSGIESVRCSGEPEDWYCPKGMQCHDTRRCVFPSDVEACEGLHDGEICTSPSVAGGVCQDGVCIVIVDCGNETIEHPEVCDGNNVGGITCEILGFYPGLLACLPDCSDFDTSSCGGLCGDGQINGPEACDGQDFNGDTCEARGFYTGSLGCVADCTSIDESGCAGYCGDGVCDQGFGETRATCVDDCPVYVTISAGSHHSCAVASDGTAWCWGYNNGGQLGNGSTTDSSTPVRVTGLTNAVAISAGGFHTCAVEGDGMAWCWGKGSDGRLGNGSTADSYSPVQVTQLPGFANAAVAISTGVYHSCAVTSSGTAWCWGMGSDGRLGNNSTADSSTPVPVTGLTNAVAISAGGYHSCAVASNGTAWCWGMGLSGRLGNGSLSDSSTPVQVKDDDLANAGTISARDHSCAVASDSTAWCWGEGNYGKLGDGFGLHSSVPVHVTGLTNAVAISAGRDHSCAVASNGTAWCWGMGSDGRLGNGSLLDSSTPVQVPGFTNAVVISAGAYHSCAVASDGTAWCWGRGEYGRLGNGSDLDSSTPVQVIAPGAP